MLSFLETGNALYLLSAVCLLGVFGRLITDHLYKRLTKETGKIVAANQTATGTVIKNKRLRTIKQNAETTYRINHGIGNTRAYLEHQIQGLRLANIPLSSWNRFSNRMTLLCFFLGGAGAFLSYWYRCDTYYIVLYGSVGILAGLFSLLPDAGAGPGERKQQLLTALLDYLENSLFYTGGLPAETTAARENIRKSTRFAAVSRADDAPEEAVSKEEIRRAERGHASIRRKERIGKKSLTPVPSLTPVEREATPRPIVENRSEPMKRSLEQIAASRERHKSDDGGWIKDLTPEELQLIGDILKEYLA